MTAVVRTLGGLRPGTPLMIIPGEATWKPCLTRSEVEGFAAREHAWFVDKPGSLFCPSCRPGKPIAIVGPRDAIADIREALERGDRREVERLVRELRGGEEAPSVATSPEPVVGGADNPPRITTSHDRSGTNARDEVATFHHAQASGFKPRDRADWLEFMTERAAIAEYVGGAPRAVAEALAREIAGPEPRWSKSGPLFSGAR